MIHLKFKLPVKNLKKSGYLTLKINRQHHLEIQKVSHQLAYNELEPVILRECLTKDWSRLELVISLLQPPD